MSRDMLIRRLPAFQDRAKMTQKVSPLNKIQMNLEKVIYKSINVVYADGSQESFTPSSKVEEFEDSYEFDRAMAGNGGMTVVLMKNQIRKIEFCKE
jgi:hypothetical protein